MKIVSRAAMQAYGAKMAKEILRSSTTSFKKGGNAKVIALTGELGAGKTTFTQGFLKALGVKHTVISPTFLIIRRYALKKIAYTDAFHIDCYRIERPEELIALSLKEVIKNPKNIVLIEWPELIKKYLPKDTRHITIHHGAKKTERIVS